MPEDRFIAVERPSPAEGVGRALQAAFSNGYELPAELSLFLRRLDRVAR